MLKKYCKILLPIIITVVIMYLLVYIDLVLRARHAYLEAEKYYFWYEHPEEKQKALQEKFNLEKSKFDKKLLKKKISKEEYERNLEIAKFNLERELEESAIKYAYIWYQTAVELFSPPESKYVRLSRKKMETARELWKKELESKGIKVEPYMLE